MTQPQLQQSRLGRQTGDLKSAPKYAHHEAEPVHTLKPSLSLSTSLSLSPDVEDTQARNHPFLASHNDGQGHGSSSAYRQPT